MKEKRKNMSRREFMQYTGAGALGIAGGLNLGGFITEAHAADEPFRIIGGPEDLLPPIIEEFEKTFKIKFEPTLATHPELNNKMLTGGDRIYDAAET